MRRNAMRYAWAASVVILAITVIVDLGIARLKEMDITLETLASSFPVYGSVSAFGFVLLAKTLAIALRRKDSFYGNE